MSSGPVEPAINQPQVIAEVRAVFEEYEAALLRNDIEALNHFFLDCPETVRYGVAEHSVGISAIRAYRREAPPIPAGRRLQNTVIVTFGRELACVSTEFLTPESRYVGRQTQTWIRLAEGWRIMAAHVSQVDSQALKRY
jgi:hypothetical protein